VRRHQEATDVYGAAGLRRPRVERGLQVDVLKHRQVTADDGVRQAVGAEEVRDEAGGFVDPAVGVRAVDPVKERTEGSGEFASLPVGRLGRHGSSLATGPPGKIANFRFAPYRESCH
jgi:hypothetical protein